MIENRPAAISSYNLDVIKKPLITKNTSTPVKPPGNRHSGGNGDP
jgi:hypothetical protein